MPKTIIGGGGGGNSPPQFYPPFVETCANWSDGFSFDPDLELLSASISVGSHDLDQCTLLYRYGAVKQPWESAYDQRSARDLVGNWVRVSVVNEQGAQGIWIGKIAGEGRQIFGESDVPSGRQELVCYGAQQLLRKRYVSTSGWLVDDEIQVLGWVPHINDRDERGMLIGNRSDDRGSDNVYLYGGTSLWYFSQYIDYLLKYFMDESDSGGPAWTLSGQREILAGMCDITQLYDKQAHRAGSPVHLAETQTVAGILAQLISPSYGIDYKIVGNDDGFQIVVFALNAQEFSFQGQSLPSNPWNVSVQAGQDVRNLSTRLVRSTDQQFGRIRLMGKRMVICCSLDAGPPGEDGVQSEDATLVNKWTDEQESAYLEGTGDEEDSADAHDAVRKTMPAAVFQQYGAPADWDHNHGTAAPWFDYNGEYQERGDDCQNVVRKTLPWLPLQEGFDYTQYPPVDNNPEDHTPDFLRPLAFVYDEDAERYLLADEAGIGVHVPQHDWGIFLSAAPAHLLAKHHWEAGTADARPTNHDPKYDWQRLLATIAFEGDQRITFEVDLGGAPSDGYLDILAPDAEFWYLAPNTAVGVDKDGKILRSPSPYVVLRDDSDKLRLAMAGAISRYRQERCRAEIVGHGLLPWTGLLGQILTAVDSGSGSQDIQAPITSIHWHNGERPTTIARTGFAS